MRALFLAAAIFAAGCVNSDFGGDAGVAGQPDLAVPLFDLAGLDLYGAYNCKELNALENACTTAVCIFNLRKMATPEAVFEEIALQDCFDQYCPKANICAQSDMGTYSAACSQCVNNTYVVDGKSCADKAPECHKCLQQADTCSADP